MRLGPCGGVGEGLPEAAQPGFQGGGAAPVADRPQGRRHQVDPVARHPGPLPGGEHPADGGVQAQLPPCSQSATASWAGR